MEEDFDRRVQTAEQLLPLLLDTNLENMIFFLRKQLFMYLDMSILKIVAYSSVSQSVGRRKILPVAAKIGKKNNKNKQKNL